MCQKRAPTACKDTLLTADVQDKAGCHTNHTTVVSEINIKQQKT
jgi:hypothetical protein